MSADLQSPAAPLLALLERLETRQAAATCPLCGLTLEIRYGRNSERFFATHPSGDWKTGKCPNRQAFWGLDTQEKFTTAEAVTAAIVRGLAPSLPDRTGRAAFDAAMLKAHAVWRADRQKAEDKRVMQAFWRWYKGGRPE